MLTNEGYRELWLKAIDEQIEIYNKLETAIMCPICRTMNKILKDECKVCLWHLYSNGCLEWLGNNCPTASSFRGLKVLASGGIRKHWKP